MAKKPALGRGLGAILPDFEEAARTNEDSGSPGKREASPNPFDDRPRRVGSITDIRINQIDPNPYQPRSDFGGKALDELADSIRELGIVQPITVRPAGKNRFELISGERRLRAARRAGLDVIPAYVREADTEAMLEMALVENVQRQDLNPIEIAIGYERLIDECALTHEDLARKVGKSRSAVSNTLRLLKLRPSIQSELQRGVISEGHARALAMVEDDSFQRQLLDRILREDLSVRAVERLARAHVEKKTHPEPPPKEKPLPDPNVEAVVDQLRRVYSTRVQIHSKANGAGRIELDYFSLDELERLLDLLLRSQ